MHLGYSVFNAADPAYARRAMDPIRTRPDERLPATWMVVGTGILALAAAMGIGRFAFTPLLPLMLRDGTMDAAAGAEWAAANYAGYLAGAASARWLAGNPARGLRWSLVGVAVATIAAAGGPAPFVGIALRAAAGLFSAWVLVGASGFFLGELTRRGLPQRGAWIYTGVGLGIALSGTLAWLGGGQPARWLWLELGIVAAGAAAAVGLGLAEPGTRSPASAPGAVGHGGPWRPPRPGAVLRRFRLRLHRAGDLPARHGAPAGVGPPGVRPSPGHFSGWPPPCPSRSPLAGCRAGRAGVSGRWPRASWPSAPSCRS